MLSQKINVLLKPVAKHLAALILSIVILVGFSPTPAWASPTAPGPELSSASLSSSLIALAASSRFAAQVEAQGQEPIISESRLNEMREQRREQQSRASAAAAAAAEKDTTNESAGEVVKDKLNLEEITEENEILGQK